jgi:hypothetical protein
VDDIRFQGNLTGKEITGSYVVSRSDGQQIGDFQLKRTTGADSKYRCSSGMLTEAQTDRKPNSEGEEVAACIKSGICKVVSTNELPSAPLRNKPKPVGEYAVVNTDYAAIEKRCAFLPSDNYRRCGYQPTTIAKPRKGDRLRLLSLRTRADNGEDIYEVRTEQGWVGWIDSKFLGIE